MTMRVDGVARAAFRGLVAAGAAAVVVLALGTDDRAVRYVLLALVVASAGLALAGARATLLGPVGEGRAPRMVRGGGYLMVLAALLLIAATNRAYPAGPGARSFVLLVGLVLTGYLATVLALTARRSSATAAALVTGAACGLVGGAAVFALMPLERALPPPAHALPGDGWWLLVVAAGAPLVALLVAGLRTDRADQAVLAVVGCAAVAVLVVFLLGGAAILFFPGSVPDIMGGALPPGTTAAARLRENVIEAGDPYAGVVVLLGGPLVVALAVVTRIVRRNPATAIG